MKKKRRKHPGGRPSLGKYGRTIVLPVRVSAVELAAFRRAAKAAGMPLSVWVLAPRREGLPHDA